jgi:hypothetical protein
MRGEASAGPLSEQALSIIEGLKSAADPSSRGGVLSGGFGEPTIDRGELVF